MKTIICRAMLGMDLRKIYSKHAVASRVDIVLKVTSIVCHTLRIYVIPSY